MKKTIAILLTLCLCIAFCACGKSEEATMVDNLILNIGEVSLDSDDAIQTARSSYDALTEDQKNEVENLDMLTNAEEALETLVAEYIENAKTEAETELTNRKPNAAIRLLEDVLPLDASVQEEIDTIYSYCFDFNDKSFLKPSFLYPGTELIGVSLHDSEHEFDSYYFSPIDTATFMDYCEYATQEFTLNPDETLESEIYIRYQFLDAATGETVLRISLFVYNGAVTLGVETVPQTRIHTN